MSCIYEKYIDKLLYGELGEKRRNKIYNHIKNCEYCSKALKKKEYIMYRIKDTIGNCPYISNRDSIINTVISAKRLSINKLSIINIKKFACVSAFLILLFFSILLLKPLIDTRDIAQGNKVSNTPAVIDSGNLIRNNDRRKIILYNTHPSEAYDYGDCITKVTDELANKLSLQGISCVHLMNTNIYAKESYEISHDLITEQVNDFNTSILLDIHMDIRPEGFKGNNKDILIMIGKGNPYYEKNMEFGNLLLNELMKSDKVNASIKTQGIVIYNQDLSPYSLLIYIGVNHSSKEDICECVDTLSLALGKLIDQI